MEKESFVLYKSFYEPIKGLCKEDKSDLLDAIFVYQVEGREPFNTSRIYPYFLFFKNQFRLDDLKYEQVVNRNKLNGSKGGRPIKPKEPTLTDINPENPLGFKEPKKADKDNEKENVIKKKRELKISFQDSEIFDPYKFRDAFPTWNRAKLKHYHAAADQYSTEGNKYVDWKKAIENWARKADAEGKLKFPDEQEVKKSSFTTGV